MPFDSFPERVPNDGNFWQLCRGCERPIMANQPVAKIELPHDPITSADKANGTYHAECAKPLMGLIGVLETLQRFG